MGLWCGLVGRYDYGKKGADVTQAHQDIRWQQRFQNFSRAFGLLREAIERPADSLSQLEKEGIIQRFEYTFELRAKLYGVKASVFPLLQYHSSQALWLSC